MYQEGTSEIIFKKDIEILSSLLFLDSTALRIVYDM